jgi:hypothetical protein
MGTKQEEKKVEKVETQKKAIRRLDVETAKLLLGGVHRC